MRVPVCVRCKAVMAPRWEGARYVNCPNLHCKNWFPVALVNRRHQDGEINAVWQLYTRWFRGKPVNSWERVSKAKPSVWSRISG